MRTPHFLRLAQIDEQRFISACRHGMVHLSWGRATIRFTRDEFRRLAAMLARARDTLGPSFVREGEIEITYRPAAECEIRVGAVVLLLSAAEYATIASAVQEGVQKLDDILSSGVWDRDGDEDAPQDFWEPLRRTPFSKN